MAFDAYHHLEFFAYPMDSQTKNEVGLIIKYSIFCESFIGLYQQNVLPKNRIGHQTCVIIVFVFILLLDKSHVKRAKYL